MEANRIDKNFIPVIENLFLTVLIKNFNQLFCFPFARSDPIIFASLKSRPLLSLSLSLTNPNPRTRARSRYLMADPALSPQAISPLTPSPKKNEGIQDSGAKIKELSESQETSPLSNSPNKEGAEQLGVRIKDLDESQSELLSKIQGMKENVQSWRSMMDTQLKSYKDELSGLKKQLETELEELSLGFNELKTTLQKQQEDVANSLKSLGLQDVPKPSGESAIEHKKEDTSDKAQYLTSESKDETKPAGESSTE